MERTEQGKRDRPEETAEGAAGAGRCGGLFLSLPIGFLFANEFFSHDSVSYFTYATGTPAFYAGIGRFLIPRNELIKGAGRRPG